MSSRITSQHRDRRLDADRQQGRRRAGHGFCAAFPEFRPHLRPPQLIRIIEPVAGLPRITIRVRPTSDYGVPMAGRSIGSNHIRYSAGDTSIRVTTDAPLSYIDREAAFVLTRPVHLVMGADEPFIGGIAQTCREFETRTADYWREWVRRLNLSYDWQEAMIRAAITLKLSNFEETGGIIAAHTTSIPEAPGSGRNWDYRYCWLRDAYFVVKALNRIGATQTMEDFIFFILNIASEADEGLRPVYSVVPTDPMDEWMAPHLRATAAMDRCASATPPSTRSSMTPMAASSWPRCRCSSTGACRGRAMKTFSACSNGSAPRRRSSRSSRMPASGNIAAASASTPIRSRCAGPDVNGSPRSRTRSGLPIARRLERGRGQDLQSANPEQSWNPKRKAFTAAFGSDDLDASVLLLPELGVIEVDDPRFVKTVDGMERELARETCDALCGGQMISACRKPHS